MGEQGFGNGDNRKFLDKAQLIDCSPNPYKNLAYLPLRQVEQLLLSGFCADELTINLKSQYQKTRVSA